MCGGQCSGFPYYFTSFKKRDFFFPFCLDFKFLWILLFLPLISHRCAGNIDGCITASGFYRSSVELNTGYETCMSVVFTH